MDKLKWPEPGAPTPGSPEPVERTCAMGLRDSMARYGEMRYCTRPLGWGTGHAGYGACKLHGGKSPNHERKWARVMAEEQAASLLAKLGDDETDPLGDPVVELYAFGGRVRRWEQIAQRMLSELDAVDTTDRGGVERAKAKVEIYERALRITLDTLTALERMGIARKRLELDQAQGELLGQVILAVLQSPVLDLTDIQLDRARELVAAEVVKIAPLLQPRALARADAEYEDDPEVVDAEVVG